jgi:protein required for attachment to host cells
MLLPHGTFFAIVDGENFELFRNTGTEPQPRLDPIAVPDLETTNYSAGARDHDKVSRFNSGAPKDRESKLEERAHAVAVTEWLNSEVLAGRIDRLVIIADPKSLGEMRRHYHKKLSEVLMCDLGRTLTKASADDIVKIVRAAA